MRNFRKIFYKLYTRKNKRGTQLEVKREKKKRKPRGVRTGRHGWGGEVRTEVNIESTVGGGERYKTKKRGGVFVAEGDNKYKKKESDIKNLVHEKLGNESQRQACYRFKHCTTISKGGGGTIKKKQPTKGSL